MPPTIPVDVIKYIIEHVSDDKETLGSCALTHHTWLPYARTEQFRIITYRVENNSIDRPLTESESVMLSKIGSFVSNICIRAHNTSPRLRQEELNMSTLYEHLCWLAPFLSSRLRKIYLVDLDLIVDEQMAKSDDVLGEEDRRVILDLLEGITELDLISVRFSRPMGRTPLGLLLSTFPNLDALTCVSIGWDMTEVQQQSDITRALEQHPLKYLFWHDNPQSPNILSVLHWSPNIAYLCFLSIGCQHSPLISLVAVLPMALSLQRLELYDPVLRDLRKCFPFS
jgi:hypothetical protein